MRDNYQSFLNVIFSSKRILADCLIGQKEKLPQKKLEEFEALFTKVFPPVDPTADSYYYRHAIEKVGEKLRLYQQIADLKKN